MVATDLKHSMNHNDLTFGLIVASIASLISFIVMVTMCLCCYKPKSADDDDDDLPKIATYQSIHDTEQLKRDDVKLLKKHPWKDPKASSPHLTRKSINFLKSAVYTLRFERPADKRFVTENVQPDQYSPSSLNRSLGVHSRDALVPTSAKNSEGDGSTASSPYHKTLKGEADGASASALDMVPLDLPDFPTGGEKLGKIQIHLSYDFQEMTLTLKIIRATDLPAKDFSGTSDPYVKIMLLPDKKSKLQTNIKRKNLNPRWNEVFAFEGFPYSKLVNRTLYLQVLDYDRFSRDDPIGEVCIPLADVDLAQGETMWKSLQPCKGHTAGKLGELLLSLCYQPTVGRITVVVIKARELKAKDINGLSDPYVKIWLCHEGKKVEKKKTTIKEKTLNPVFNESFIFNVPYERIRHTSLNISVMDYDRLGRNELIGQIILGSKSGPMEVKHWNEMFAKSRTPVAQWHILKDFG